MPRLYLSPTDAPNAFAAGRNHRRAAICCTSGLVDRLDQDELRAVLAHELMHIKNRDALFASVVSVLAGMITGLAEAAMIVALFFSGTDDDERPNPVVLLALTLLAPIAAAMIQLAISRGREYEADAAAARLTGRPEALSMALRKIDQGTRQWPLPPEQMLVNTGHLMIVNPFRADGVARIFSTHPPIQDRIARLESMVGYL
jgi:heat shock protein HtpX